MGLSRASKNLANAAAKKMKITSSGWKMGPAPTPEKKDSVMKKRLGNDGGIGRIK